MGDTLQLGDEVRLADGRTGTINGFIRVRGIYFVDGSMYYRHEFEPVKWDGDILGNTGIGVCAKNGSGQ